MCVCVHVICEPAGERERGGRGVEVLVRKPAGRGRGGGKGGEKTIGRVTGTQISFAFEGRRTASLPASLPPSQLSWIPRKPTCCTVLLTSSPLTCCTAS